MIKVDVIKVNSINKELMHLDLKITTNSKISVTTDLFITKNGTSTCMLENLNEIKKEYLNDILFKNMIGNLESFFKEKWNLYKIGKFKLFINN
jgi:hypothetical protein